MKGIKIAYWITTTIVSLMMAYSGFAYLTKIEMVQGFQHLGFPGYFRIELAVAKLLGAVLLLGPVSSRLKEWVYAGFTITFISALIAHTASGDPVAMRIAPVIFLLIIATSYITYHKLITANKKTITIQDNKKMALGIG